MITLASIPTLRFDQRVDPSVEVPAGDVGPDVVNLFLTSTRGFFDVAEKLFDRPTATTVSKIFTIDMLGSVLKYAVVSPFSKRTITTRIGASAILVGCQERFVLTKKSYSSIHIDYLQPTLIVLGTF
jgi:hypothetical protein